MAGLNGAQLIAGQLTAAGIDTVFTVPGGPILEVLAESYKAGIRIVGCRHEESAALMASAWGYIKKKPGVVVVSSGPGMTNTVTSMYVATSSAMPLVVLGGSARSSVRGFGGFQEADQTAFASPACKWTTAVEGVRRIPEHLYLALNKAVSGRPGAVYVDVPGQLITEEVPEEEVRWRAAAPDVSPPHPDPAAIEDLAEMLAAAERPLILIGKGAAWADAGPALERLVNLGIPFVASPMGRGTVPDDNPMCVNAARTTALSNADAVLMIGGRFNWLFHLGNPQRYAKGVRIAQIDIVPEEMYGGANLEIGVVGDCAAAVEQLCDALAGPPLKAASTDWIAALAEQCRKNEAAVAEESDSDQVPINHYRLLRDLRDCLPRDATVAVDGELTMGVARVILPSFHPRHRLNAGTTGCMGTGVPYAIGAKVARPDQPVVALVGDFAFGTAAIEIETAARSGLNVVFVVANNAGINAHSVQDRFFPSDAPPIAALLPARYEKMAEMVGGHAELVQEPGQIKPAIERALAADTVALVNVMTDPKGARRGASYL